MHSLGEINPAARLYLEEIGVEKWARCCGTYSRYNLKTSNISESLNNVFNGVKGEPIVVIALSFRNSIRSPP